MKVFLFLVVGLAVSSADTDEIEIIEAEEIGQPQDITEINQKSNLRDDILEAPNRQRSSHTNDIYLWKSPVSYVLENDLDINAKGVILRAFDEYRLKSCIDFRPRKDEHDYISVKKLDGCFSYVGRVSGGQNISIGRYCDTIGIVQHEFLHALGFYHEQSRYDRDDYVNILCDNIELGFESNFQKVGKTESTVSGIPYDYNSLMHYSSYAFTNGNGPTIVIKDVKFMNVIGQSQQLSPLDVMELNRRYKCNSTIAFHMYCSFSHESMCGMNNRSNRGNDNGWKMVKQAQEGPKTDHTTLPTGRTKSGTEEGYFMHASTASGEEGETSWLETKMMEPTRQCHVQCLQFYYYHSGNESDMLNIWIREFDDQSDSEGTRRLMGQITGPQTSHWRIHYVSLNASKPFQVVFEARTGAGSSSGGFSIDDINLSEIECPHGTLQIDNVWESLMNASIIQSPRQYTRDGYAYAIVVFLNKYFISVFMVMVSGKNDEKLEWPCLQRQMTLRMLDQTTNLQLHMSSERSFTTSTNHRNSLGICPWDNPRKNGTAFIDENNQIAFAGTLYGYNLFAHDDLTLSRNYIKGDSLILTFSFKDLNPLMNESALPCPELARIGNTVASQLPITFGFSPAMVASPVLTLLLALMLSMP